MDATETKPRVETRISTLGGINIETSRAREFPPLDLLRRATEKTNLMARSITIEQLDRRTGANPQIFHDLDHSDWVAAIADAQYQRKIEVVQRSSLDDQKKAELVDRLERRRLKAQADAYGHDLQQDFDVFEAKPGLKISLTRKRRRGPNEAEAAKRVRELKVKANEGYSSEGYVIYEDEDMKLGDEAINDGTYVNFEPGRGLVQVRLTDQSSWDAFALANGDLKGVLIDGSIIAPGLANGELFVRQGAAEFQELNIEITNQIVEKGLIEADAHPERLDLLVGEDRNYASREMLKWLLISQPDWVKAQKKDFDERIGQMIDPELVILEQGVDLNPQVRQSLRENIFNGYNQSEAVTIARQSEAAHIVAEVISPELDSEQKISGWNNNLVDKIDFSRLSNERFLNLLKLMRYLDGSLPILKSESSPAPLISVN